VPSQAVPSQAVPARVGAAPAPPRVGPAPFVRGRLRWVVSRAAARGLAVARVRAVARERVMTQERSTMTADSVGPVRAAGSFRRRPARRSSGEGAGRGDDMPHQSQTSGVAGPAAGWPESGEGSPRDVFVIHGRDEQCRQRFFELLRAVDLRPLEWEQLVSATNHGAPSLLDVVQSAVRRARAVLVLLTPDDIVELHPVLRGRDESAAEATPSMQARPNVLVELGMALAIGSWRTIIVEVGNVRPVADLGGLHMIRFDGSEAAIGTLVQRLKTARCAVDDSGTDWRDPRRFAHLDAYRRGPA
jgi:CAP12/Pycsar effector protein, TIR domain